MLGLRLSETKILSSVVSLLLLSGFQGTTIRDVTRSRTMSSLYHKYHKYYKYHTEAVDYIRNPEDQE